MLEYDEAREKIRRHTPSPCMVRVPLRDARGCVAAQKILARHPFPHFDNSAVDGYAIGFPLAGKERERQVYGEIRAGSRSRRSLEPGQAMRIFTGAPVPPGTYAVLMQEYAVREGSRVRFLETVEEKAHIRFQGEDIAEGSVLIPAGTRLGPAHMALLATAGCGRVAVFKAPRVFAFATGNELTLPGEKLKRGQIFDSNTVLLESLAAELGAKTVISAPVSDNLLAIRCKIREGLSSADVLIISGGVSVGDYDFVKQALKEEGVREIFWGIRIKPGKPVFFGIKGKKLVFGLPGNPVSVFVTFREFVRPALLALQGRPADEAVAEAIVKKTYQNGPRRHFVRVRLETAGGARRAEVLQGQGSHMVGSLALADGLLDIPPDVLLKKGARVIVKALGEK